jgi:pimeloyl-ACP methyl ester carboxylesterase
MRAHRVFYQIAQMLADAGFHVFRFDYYGTGDSAGNDADVDLTQWRANVLTAVQELRDVSGLNKIRLVGLRLGAALAFLAADEVEPDLIVLWDPVVRGEEYLHELKSLHTAMLVDPDRFVVPRESSAADEESLLGFTFPTSLCCALRDLDISARPVRTHRIVMIVSEERPEYAVLRARIERAGTSFAYHYIPVAGDWHRLDRIESALMPYPILQAIIGVLTDAPH